MADEGGLRRWLPSVRTAMIAFLALQAVVAVAVFSEDIWRAIEFGGRDEVRTVETSPATPGDQRRPYSPAMVPSQPDRQLRLQSPIPIPETLPVRLTFTVKETETNGRVLLVAGEIDEGAADRFRGFLEDMPAPPDAVAFHSPGGKVLDAQEIGRIIRGRDLPTMMFADAACLSACPYMLAGGAERTVSNSAWIGLHQHFYDQSVVLPAYFAVKAIQEGQGETLLFLEEMGIDPMLLVHGLKTPPEDMYLLVEEELLEYGLATEVTP